MRGAIEKGAVDSQAGAYIPPEEAKLLARLWTSSTRVAFPVKGRPTRAEAAELVRMLLRSRLRAEEMTEGASEGMSASLS